MNALNAFLSADLSKTINVAIPRLGIHLKVKALTTEEITKLNERATYGDTVDEKKLSGLVIATASTNVDFGDQRAFIYVSVRLHFIRVLSCPCNTSSRLINGKGTLTTEKVAVFLLARHYNDTWKRAHLRTAGLAIEVLAPLLL